MKFTNSCEELKIKNLFSKIYHKTIGRFFTCVKLYKIDLLNFNNQESQEQIDLFKFTMPTEKYIILFEKLYERDPKKIENLNLIFKSGKYLCFAYMDQKESRIAYVRWLCKGNYYSKALCEQLIFAPDEALTLDSYTHPDYRFLGLHRKMNIQMLQWIKENTDIRYVYMVILCFYPHLTKIPLWLGYRPVKTKVYYKKKSISLLFDRMIKKLFIW